MRCAMSSRSLVALGSVRDVLASAVGVIRLCLSLLVVRYRFPGLFQVPGIIGNRGPPNESAGSVVKPAGRVAVSLVPANPLAPALRWEAMDPAGGAESTSS